MFAQELREEKIICLSGDLGTGKTTFTQGFLKGLKIKGPYTSPTFLIMKRYCITHNVKRVAQNVKHKTLCAPRSTFHDIYHIDAYRIKEKGLLNLGWKEITADKKNVIIIEWAERVKKIIPKNSVWIKFKWIDENKREIKFF